MSGVCWCGRCYGCSLAREAGGRYDATEVEAREQAESDEFADQLAEYVDDDGRPHSLAKDPSQ